jgi:hypothetical protein
VLLLHYRSEVRGYAWKACHLQDTPLRRNVERSLVRWAANMWVASWCGVIKYHGPKPVPAPHRIWVANHSSMIDYTILTAYMPFACIMQLQPGWVEFLQRRILTCLGCLLFNRTEVFINFALQPGICCGQGCTLQCCKMSQLHSLSSLTPSGLLVRSGVSACGVSIVGQTTAMAAHLPRLLQFPPGFH